MSVIEVLLRLGCALVAWMIIYTQLIWTAILEVTGCQSDGDQMWRLLLGFAPVTLGFCLLINVSRKLREVHAILIWFAAPLLLLVPLALNAIWPWLISATFGGAAICGIEPTPAWHLWWAPVQLVVMATIVFAAGRLWVQQRRLA